MSNKKPDGPGIIPVEYKVVVLPDEPKDVTSGGIVVPDVVKDKLKWRTSKATLVAVGGNAFQDWQPPIPKPGDRVYVAIAAGIVHVGPDGREYRIVNDKDIAGIIEWEDENDRAIQW